MLHSDRSPEEAALIAAMVVILILLFVLLLVGLRRAWRRFQHRMTISHSEFGGDGEK